jgi:hypothetical protein
LLLSFHSHSIQRQKDFYNGTTHSLFPLKFRQVVKALMLGAKRQDGTPYYPQTHFYKLPEDLLFEILQHALCCCNGNLRRKSVSF